MKTQITKLIKTAFLMLVTIAFFSCSKKDDDSSQTATSGLDYNVDCQYTINGISYSGKASYLNIPIGSAADGCEKSSFQITRAGSDDLINIGSLRQEGGTFDSPMGNAASQCNKMGMSVNCTLPGQPFQRYVSNIASSNLLTLSGKTYTLTCKVYYNNTNLNSANTTVTATWTKP